MGARTPKRVRHSVSAYVDVDVDEILSEAGDDQIRDEYRARFGPCEAATAPAFDLIEEVRNELVGGRVNAALALCESHLVAAQIADAARQRQFQSMQAPH